ncbi:GNAT family N-acetyltransferase [Niameybacter massiliensis]|uniref:GNAT family N-acetyltransferase n=1 Tax=Holtiella tumoricola TaxID=3018743 RepID=A0AA42J0V3_9FIRM|nr:GNAT family N-acetyltransferase [Holtiella tumoricola]MDA3731732.1 GNAT family N-acetyltransferase [Holtiella tumoricola]
MIRMIEDPVQKEQITRQVLADLTEWFGLPESIEEYVQYSKELPFWADIEDQDMKGFIVLKETSPHTVELYVMGILKAFHRQQIGKNLFDVCYNYAKQQGYSYMQVKTVKEGCYDVYDQTARFYKHLGFKEFECFPTLWDEWNPCQVYVLAIH